MEDTASCSATTLIDRLNGVYLRRAKRRNNAEHESGYESNDHSKRENPKIDADGLNSWNIRADGGDENSYSDCAQYQPKRTADQTQEKTFYQRLPYEVHPRCSKGNLNRKFATTR